MHWLFLSGIVPGKVTCMGHLYRIMVPVGSCGVIRVAEGLFVRRLV